MATVIGTTAVGAVGEARMRAIVLMRRVEEAEARARLRATEMAEGAQRTEVGRLGEEARAAAERLESAQVAGSPAPPLVPRRAAALQQEDRYRARLRDDVARSVAARTAAEQRLAKARRAHEAARAEVAEAVKRRQGAEAEVKRRRSDALRGRQRREEGAAADAMMARGPRR